MDYPAPAISSDSRELQTNQTPTLISGLPSAQEMMCYQT
jgi:hypothetical protein